MVVESALQDALCFDKKMFKLDGLSVRQLAFYAVQ